MEPRGLGREERHGKSCCFWGTHCVCSWAYGFPPSRGFGAGVKNHLLDLDTSGLGPQLCTFLAV